MLSVSFDSHGSTFCMVIVPFICPLCHVLSPYTFLYPISNLCVQWSLYHQISKGFYCLFFSQCRFRFNMITFLILYGKLCNYFIWHDALRAIVVGGKFESGIRVMQKF